MIRFDLGAATLRATTTLLLLGLATPALHAEETARNLMLIFDASGSMQKKLPSGDTRLGAAKSALSEVLGSVDGDLNLGLTMFGHRERKQCRDIEIVSPIGSDDAATLADIVNGTRALGETPIADAITKATRSFKALAGADNRILLVTDGIEECGGDVCEAARAAADLGVGLKIDVVGFTLGDAQREAIACVADLTGGSYYDASDAATLTASLARATAAGPQAANLLLAENGGELVVAPNADWQRLSDGEEDWSNLESVFPGGEAVWSLNNGEGATIERLEWLIAEQDAFNLKSLDIFASTEAQSGPWEKVATCSFSNAVMLKSPYQGCDFAPVSARFVKIVLNDTYDWQKRVSNREMRLLGTPGPSADATTGAEGTDAGGSSDDMSETGPINLITSANGGTLEVAPNAEWARLSDGKDDYSNLESIFPGGEAIWSFAGGASATFDRFEWQIEDAEAFNLHEAEILVSDSLDKASFVSLGVCSFENARLMRDSFQACGFAPATGRYVMVRLLSTYDPQARVANREMRLFGTLDGEAGPIGDTSAPSANEARPANPAKP